MKQVAHDSFLQVPLQDEENKEFDFCMCNPPFFISDFEASHGTARNDKRPQPSGVCTGTETETVTGGGEMEFVKGIIKDSLTMKEQFRYLVCPTLFIHLSVLLSNPLLISTFSLVLIHVSLLIRRLQEKSFHLSCYLLKIKAFLYFYPLQGLMDR